MKLKCEAKFTGIYLIRYDIVHLVSAGHRVSFSIHMPISDRVSRINIQRTESTAAVFVTVMFFICLKSTLGEHLQIQNTIIFSY